MNIQYQKLNNFYEYEDVLIESMRVHLGKIPLLNYHIDRVLWSIDLLSWCVSKEAITTVIYKNIKTLSNQLDPNIYYKLRLCIGKSLKEESYHIYIDTEILPSINTLQIHLLGTKEIEPPQYSGIKSYQNIINLSTLRKSLDLDQDYIITHNNQVIETTFTNIYFVYDNYIITPPSNNLFVKGVLRNYIQQEHNILFQLPIIEQNINIKYSLLAKYIFLSNAVRGIMFVKYFNEKYFNIMEISEDITTFNQTIFNSKEY
jgi:branched-subunit amino acid aminotransferase/4-amino-4-deoxychorismate lyase